jgi:hypothetical protein
MLFCIYIVTYDDRGNTYISIFHYHTRRCFDDDETAGPIMLIHINERILKPHSRMRAAWFCRVYFHSHDGGSFQWFHSVLKAPKEGWGPKLWPSFEIKTVITNNPFLVRDLLKFPKEPWQWTGYLHREAFYEKQSIKNKYLLLLGFSCVTYALS